MTTDSAHPEFGDPRPRWTPACRVVTLADGTKVRVRGEVDMDRLEAIAADVKAQHDSECHHVGPHPMPEIAQRIHGRPTYWCGLPRGHKGPHRWGTRQLIEWENADA